MMNIDEMDAAQILNLKVVYAQACVDLDYAQADLRLARAGLARARENLRAPGWRWYWRQEVQSWRQEVRAAELEFSRALAARDSAANRRAEFYNATARRLRYCLRALQK